MWEKRSGRERQEQEELMGKGLKERSGEEQGQYIGRRGRAQGRRRQQILMVVMLAAAVVLAVSLWQLGNILADYLGADASYAVLSDQMGHETVAVPDVPAGSGESTGTEEAGEEAEDRNRGGTQAGTGEQEPEETKKQESAGTVVTITVPDFEYLKDVNSDVVGWIQIPGTRIDYPVVQGSDNEFYLTHTVSGEEYSAGAIFLDAAIEDGLSDRNPILHGHNTKSGAMFSRLNRYRKQSFWEAHRYVYITTPEGRGVYEIFSAYETEPDSDNYYFGFEADDVFQEYLDRVRSQSFYDTGVSVTKDDFIVTLSTCANNVELRFVVHAKRVEN